MDIVERLRTDFWREGDADLKEAADEIERLRGALKTFADNVRETNAGIDKNWTETVYPLKAEIERLRQQNAELLKALTDLYEACRWEKVAPEIDAAKSAIAKATGKPTAESE